MSTQVSDTKYLNNQLQKRDGPVPEPHPRLRFDSTTNLRIHSVQVGEMRCLYVTPRKWTRPLTPPKTPTRLGNKSESPTRTDRLRETTIRRSTFIGKDPPRNSIRQPTYTSDLQIPEFGPTWRIVQRTSLVESKHPFHTRTGRSTSPRWRSSLCPDGDSRRTTNDTRDGGQR